MPSIAPEIQFGLDVVKDGQVVIPTPYFGGKLRVNPRNTIIHEYEGEYDTFNHVTLRTRDNLNEFAFWPNAALKARLIKMGVQTIRSAKISESALKYTMVRKSHEQLMGYSAGDQ